jgi:ribose 5-phosphate isomerase A
VHELKTGAVLMRDDVELLKKAAAYRAVGFVQPGMIVGLGHGSTAIHAIRRIAELINSSKLHNIRGVPCSKQVEDTALNLGIPLASLDENCRIDLTIDGADEVDPALNLIKGGGGALLREKIVAQASLREIIVVDESKLSPVLGKHRSIPIETVPFGLKTQKIYLEELGAQVSIRKTDKGDFFLTDQGNFILDCSFGPIKDPSWLAARLCERAGIVEHGLFIGIATDVIVAGPGGLRHLKKSI